MRLDPKTFWAMTPLELAIASGLHAEAPVGGAPDRNALQALMRSYPDRGAWRERRAAALSLRLIVEWPANVLRDQFADRHGMGGICLRRSLQFRK